jgi:hypothetical protein
MMHGTGNPIGRDCQIAITVTTSHEDMKWLSADELSAAGQEGQLDRIHEAQARTHDESIKILVKLDDLNLEGNSRICSNEQHESRKLMRHRRTRLKTTTACGSEGPSQILVT